MPTEQLQTWPWERCARYIYDPGYFDGKTLVGRKLSELETRVMHEETAKVHEDSILLRLTYTTFVAQARAVASIRSFFVPGMLTDC